MRIRNLRRRDKEAMNDTRHWTASTIDDFVYWISSDFTAQIETKLEAEGIDQNALALRLKVSPSYVSQVLNDPGNLTLETAVKYSRAMGKKVALVTYDDSDPDNEKGPINADLFTACWERLGKPRDLFDLAAMRPLGRVWVVYAQSEPRVPPKRERIKFRKFNNFAATSQQAWVGSRYA